MSALNEFAIPAHVKQKIKDLGYSVSSDMDQFIELWWGWYTGTDNWHDVKYKGADNKHHTRRRLTLNTARRAPREWARLILDKDTQIAVETPKANEWLQDYLETSHFLANSRDVVETAFALGTGAWALRFNVSETSTEVGLRSYDARMIVPLTYDDDGITECAFITQVRLKKNKLDQLQMHTIGENGTYVIRTYLFKDGDEVSPESYGILDEFDTSSPVKTFGIIKPGIKNTVVDLSPYGMSVYGDAIDAMKAVDLTWDSMMQEIDLTAPLVFMDDALIDVRDENGRAVPVPRGSQDDRMFRKLAGQSGKSFYEVYSPEIRTTPIREAFNVALSEFGDLSGFGQNYFTLDKSGNGLKTATEVASDNSALIRNISSHEESIAVAICDIMTALLTCARIHSEAPVEEDFGPVTVSFEDSILEDTTAEKNMMMAEIAAGLIPKWKYAVEFYGMTEDEAKAALPAEEIVDIGY